MSRRFVSGDEAPRTERQISTPCSDCPFARASIPGWLGEDSPEQWIKNVHGEAQINCHALDGPQCAGAAIYRANVSKKPRDPALLVLPRDKERVFATPMEFLGHHLKPRG